MVLSRSSYAALQGAALAVIVVVVGDMGARAVLARNPSRVASRGGMGSMPMAWSVTSRAAGRTVTQLHQRLVHVTIHNFAFQPARLVVSPGTKVVWTNTDSDPHTVDSSRNLWTSEALDTSGVFVRTFRATGTFSYYCSIHPYMHGVIAVKK